MSTCSIFTLWLQNLKSANQTMLLPYFTCTCMWASDVTLKEVRIAQNCAEFGRVMKRQCKCHILSNYKLCDDSALTIFHFRTRILHDAHAHGCKHPMRSGSNAELCWVVQRCAETCRDSLKLIFYNVTTTVTLPQVYMHVSRRCDLKMKQSCAELCKVVLSCAELRGNNVKVTFH